ncbi:MAG: histidine--tRNA ligase [Bdellovibrionota bacterium]
MALSSQSYKGTRDFYPQDMAIRRWMFDRMRQVIQRYGYLEYDGPLLEPFDLFAAKTGEEIVNQQLYWLIDRGGRKLAIRPEMTPTLARMVAARFHELAKPIRWFSIPNLWRYERPQRGRLREHWQLNVDVLGGDPLLADAEILTLAVDLMKTFGGEQNAIIKVNNRKLIDHFFGNVLGLSADAALKIVKVLDAKAKIGEEAYKAVLDGIGISADQKDKMEKFFSSSFADVSRAFKCVGTDELNALFDFLAQSGVKGESVVFDPTVMRGMDYYTGTVFEMYDTSPDNRRAIFGGGRYDNLLAIFGNYKLSGVGFGLGDVTMQNFLETHGLLPKIEPSIDVFIALPAAKYRLAAEQVACLSRNEGLSVITPLGVDGFSQQLKLAVKHGAKFVVLFGEAEFAEGKAIIKDLLTATQEVCVISGLHLRLKELAVAKAKGG